MHRDQEIGILLTRDVRTPHDRDKIIAVAGQDAFKHRVVVQHCPQLTGNGDGHVLLTRPTRPDGARILATVSGINRNNDFITVYLARLRCRSGHRVAAGDAGNTIAAGFKRIAGRL